MILLYVYERPNNFVSENHRIMSKIVSLVAHKAARYILFRYKVSIEFT